MGSKPNKNNNENVIINTQETVKINNLSPEIIKQNKSFDNIIQKYSNNNNNNEEELKNFDSNNNDKNENLSNKNNSTDLITLVKNDIENTYNIAEDIISIYSANSIIEHGAVLNDDNSFFNNNEQLDEVEQIIEEENLLNNEKTKKFSCKIQIIETKVKKKNVNNNNKNNNNENNINNKSNYNENNNYENYINNDENEFNSSNDVKLHFDNSNEEE